jgi:hypothetical protein
METNGLVVPLSQQTIWFLWSLVLGAVCMLIYTVLRVALGSTKKNGIVVLVDIIFFLVVALLEFLFVIMLPMNSMRWFYVAGQVIGGAIFRAGFSPYIFMVSKKFLALIQPIFCRIKRCIIGLKNMVKTPRQQG